MSDLLEQLYKVGVGLTFTYLEIITVMEDWAISSGLSDFLMTHLLDFGLVSLYNGFISMFWPIYWLDQLFL